MTDRPVSGFEFQRTPPHALETEATLLGGVLLEGDAVFEVNDILRPDSFFDTKHRAIFEAMVALSDATTPIDTLSVKDQLQKTGKLEQAGGLEYLSRLTDGLPGVTNIKTYGRIIREKALVRKAIDVGKLIVGEGYQEPASVEDYLDKMQANIFAVTQESTARRHERLNQVLARSIDELAKKADSEEGHIGVPTGFYDLDELTHGLQPSDLVILAARPAMGKTALALNMMTNAAYAGKTVAIFSLEMSNIQLANRILSMDSRVNMQQFKRGNLTNEQWLDITASMSRLNELNIYLDDTPRMTPTQIRAKCRQIAAQAHGLDLIVVDYIQLMSLPAEEGRFNNRENEISYISRSLKMLAKELNVPVLALSQLNRELEKRADKRPQMSDLRESGAIEQDADIILFIYREFVYEPKNLDLQHQAEVIIAKHRNGPTGTVELVFLNDTVRFENKTGRQDPYASDDFLEG